MKLLKRNKDEGWQKVEQASYTDEAELQDLLYEDPSIIPVQDISEDREEIKVAIKEFGLPGSGLSDIIGIDREGNITIIETKLAANSEVKREVIGQIFDYAAFLWKKTYEQFDDTIESKLGKPLLDIMSDRVEDEEWSEEDFRSSVSMNLHNGNFSLIVVVDEINDSLKRILEFVNSSSFSGPQVYALAARYFKQGDEEIFSPQIYGANIKEVEQRESKSKKRKQWDKSSIFDQAKNRLSNNEFELLKKIHRFFEKIGHVEYGTGSQHGTFGLYTEKLSSSIWTVDTNGGVRLGLGWLNNSEKTEKEDLKSLVKFVRKLSDEFETDRDWGSYYPAFKDIGKLDQENNWQEFKKVTKNFLNNIH